MASSRLNKLALLCLLIGFSGCWIRKGSPVCGGPSGTVVKSWKKTGDIVRVLAFSAAGDSLLWVASDNQIVLEPTSGHPLKASILRTENEVDGAQYLADGRVVAFSREEILIWAHGATSPQALTGHGVTGRSYAIDPSGQFLVGGGGAFDVMKGEELGEKLQVASIAGTAFTPSGTHSVEAGFHDRRVIVRQFPTAKATSWYAEENIAAASIHPDGSLVATASPGGDVTLWQVERQAVRWSRRLDGKLHGLQFTADGLSVLAFGEADIVHLDSQSGNTVRHMSLKGRPDHNAVGRSVVAVGTTEGQLKLWRLQDGACLVNADVEAPVSAIALNEESRLVGVAQEDGVVRIFRW